MQPNAVIMSGPHQGQQIQIPEFGQFVFELPAADRTSTQHRYSRNDGDDLVDGLIQLHYVDDVPKT